MSYLIFPVFQQVCGDVEVIRDTNGRAQTMGHSSPALRAQEHAPGAQGLIRGLGRTGCVKADRHEIGETVGDVEPCLMQPRGEPVTQPGGQGAGFHAYRFDP